MRERQAGSCSYNTLVGRSRCLADWLQRRKPMGAGISDKKAGSIIRYCLFVLRSPKAKRGRVRNGNNQALHRAGNRATRADKEQRYFVVIGGDIWYNLF